MPEGTGSTPQAVLFYELNDLYDKLAKLTDHQLNEFMSEISHRVMDGDRLNGIYGILRGFQTSRRR